MLIASSAMFFAVAGSAFVLRARLASECLRHRTLPAPASWESGAMGAVSPSGSYVEECGQAVYRNNPDGSVSVYFDLCPTDEPEAILSMDAAAPASAPIR
jgi:hypothetical protein